MNLNISALPAFTEFAPRVYNYLRAHELLHFALSSSAILVGAKSRLIAFNVSDLRSPQILGGIIKRTESEHYLGGGRLGAYLKGAQPLLVLAINFPSSCSHGQVKSTFEGIMSLKSLTNLKVCLFEHYTAGCSMEALAKLLLELDLSKFHLVMAESYVDDAAVQMLAPSLRSLSKLKSLKLDLRQHSSSKRIETLGVWDDRGQYTRELHAITNLGVSYLAEATGDLVHLRECSIDLSNNDFSSKGVCSMARAIEKLTCLHELGLGFSGIKDRGDDGRVAIGESIKLLTNLRRLQIDFNAKFASDVTAQGATTLCRSLSWCLLLQKLSLDFAHNAVNDQTVASVLSALEVLVGLSDLRLTFGHGSITDEGAILIARFVSKLDGLEKMFMDLSNNRIGEQGCEALAASLEQLSEKARLNKFKLFLFSNPVANHIYLRRKFFFQCRTLTADGEVCL